MKVYLSLENVSESLKRVDGWSGNYFEGSYEIELEEGHLLFTNFAEFALVDGELIHDLSHVKEMIEKEEAQAELNKKRQDIIENIDTILEDNSRTIDKLTNDLKQANKMSDNLFLMMFELLSDSDKERLIK